jgi:hypothetical protein
MPIYSLIRFEARPDTREQVERVLRDYASHVREHVAGTVFTVYCDPDQPTRFVALVRQTKPGALDLDHVLAPHLAGPLDRMPCELVTSSDLAPRRTCPSATSPRDRRRK